jgi:hypothetical protein
VLPPEIGQLTPRSGRARAGAGAAQAFLAIRLTGKAALTNPAIQNEKGAPWRTFVFKG